MHRHCDSQICIAQTRIIPSFSLEIAERKSPAASKVSRVSSGVAIITCACVFRSLYDYPLHYLYTLHLPNLCLDMSLDMGILLC